VALTVTRRVGQSLVIDGVVVVEVVKVRGVVGQEPRVRLSVHAPRELTVDRSEVWDERHGEGATDRLKVGNRTSIAERVESLLRKDEV
jgi:sRNA-binding carbon storage regulator CsrA